MSIRSTIRGYVTDTARAFDKAPVECIMSVCAAGLLSYMVEAKHNTESDVAHLVIASTITALIAWGATLRAALGAISVNRRWIESAIGAAIAAIYLLLTHDIDREVEGWRAMMILGGIALIVFSAPSLEHSADDVNLRLRRINARVFVRAIGTALYGVALFAGLALAVAAVDNLFELDLRGEIYAHTWFWIMVVLVPWVIVGGLDQYVRPIEEVDDVARVVHKMAGFLVPPLVALYLGILFLYALRIAITHELPRNLVSPMVIAAGLLCCLALILFDPEPDAPLGRRWLRYTPFLFIPLAPLGLWALLGRTGEYGWTEFRALRFAALLALLALAVPAAVRVLRGRTLALRYITILLGLVLLTGALVIPPFTKHDQQQRLRNAFRDAGVDPARPPAPQDTVRKTISSKLYGQINGAAFYLESHFGLEALAEVIPDAKARGTYAGPIAERYNLIAERRPTDELYLYGSLKAETAVSLPSANAYRIDLPNRDSTTHARLVHNILSTEIGADSILVDLTPAVEVLTTPERGDRTSLSADKAILVAKNRAGTVRGRFLIIELNGKNEKGKREASRVHGILILGNGDAWR